MRMDRRALHIGWALCVLLGGCSHAAPPEVTPATRDQPPRLVRLSIDEEWNGLSLDAPRKAHWEVVPEAAGYRLRGKATATFDDKVVASVARTVSATQVSTLTSALRAPAVPTADPAVLGVDEAAAQARLDKLAADLTRRATTDDLRKRILAWRAELRTPKGYREAVTRAVGGMAVDDYPRITIKAVFADGREVGIHSASSDIWMLPWSTEAGVNTFDPALPRALGALLPDASPNRERLLQPVQPDTSGFRVRMGTLRAYTDLDAEADGSPPR